jgi:hypothetical protein
MRGPESIPGVREGTPQKRKPKGGEPMKEKPEKKKEPREQPWFSLILKLIIIILRKP